MCLYPKLIKNRKYMVNKKNGGNVPVLPDARVAMVPIGCGKCMECKKQRANQWKTRLIQEKKTNEKRSYFVTFTFNEQKKYEYEKAAYEEAEGVEIPYYVLQNEIARIGIRRYLERVRKRTGKSVKHWFVTELGEDKGRIHIHGFIWTDNPEIFLYWNVGWKRILPMQEKGVGYVVKYMFKTNPRDKDFMPKVMSSKGIGKSYLDGYNARNNKYQKQNTWEKFKLPNGNTIGLPIYYRNKLYTEDEKEQLWLMKLDKQERWVLGKKIDVSTEKGMKLYEKVLKQAQRRNIELGYGDDQKNWKEQDYKNTIREIKNM